MISAGIDIGSRYIKFALIDGEGNPSFHKTDTGYEPLVKCREFLEKHNPDHYIATGYGRNLMEVHGDADTITEIKAVAKGASTIFPSCRTIIDIGGQDTKAVNLSSKGKVINFVMNDRCAAGTGKFFEIIAKSLNYSMDDFSNLDNGTHDVTVRINSMCTVFAESEVISLINKGVLREQIASSLHYSIADRVISLAKRAGIDGDVVFTGGCARNSYLRQVMEKKLNRTLLIHNVPDVLSAYGAALYAREKLTSG